MAAARRRPGDYWWVSGPPRLGPGLLLTPREQEIVACLWFGLGNKEIARCLGLSTQRVKNYLTDAYARLGLAGVTDRRTPAAVALWLACERATGIRLGERAA